MVAAVLAFVLAIDPAKSTASFSVSHVFVEHVSGTVKITSGTIDIDVPGGVPSKVTATLDARSFKTDDPDRDESLRGPDWFDTKQFPTWTFTSSTIVPTSSGFTVNGNLTIHGVTAPEELEVTVSGDHVHPHYHAVAHIDRTVFGIKGTPMGAAIGKVADITLDVATQ
jgi:polyisoprenoid-binding protein YceI